MCGLCARHLLFGPFRIRSAIAEKGRGDSTAPLIMAQAFYATWDLFWVQVTARTPQGVASPRWSRQRVLTPRICGKVSVPALQGAAMD